MVGKESSVGFGMAASGPVGGRPLKSTLVRWRLQLCRRLCSSLGAHGCADMFLDTGDEFMAVQFIGHELDMEPLLTVAGVCGRVNWQVKAGWGGRQ